MTREVDAVAIYEKAEHDLEHGRITLGEFEKRIEPLKHLRYDRPTEWIPCSERLPDIGDTFLVTVMVGTEIKTDVASNFGSYIDGFWDTFNDWIEDKECHVIAWMPLPEPYMGGGDNDGNDLRDQQP